MNHTFVCNQFYFYWK